MVGRFSSATVADMDNDGYPDVVATFDNVYGGTNLVAWFKNTDGLGEFSLGGEISTDVDNPYHAVAADIDGDGYLDVIAASANDGTIIVLIPLLTTLLLSERVFSGNQLIRRFVCGCLQSCNLHTG